MRERRRRSIVRLWLVVVLASSAAVRGAPARPASVQEAPAPEDVLEQPTRRRADESVNRALTWLASRQRADGSFEGPAEGQPAVTALAVLAFLSRGHLPGHGPYGANVQSAIQYILICQRDDGLFCAGEPGAIHQGYTFSHTAVYNHAISSLALSEAYGMADPALADRIAVAIRKAEGLTLGQQATPKQLPKDAGGWRYLRILNEHHSDLSVTSWQLLFLRSAKNAGFDVPSERIDNAVRYINRCFDPEIGSFQYLAQAKRPISRGMAGAGILSLCLAGQHDSAAARSAGDFILTNSFSEYRGTISEYDRYFYSAFYCTQGMFHLGGSHWRRFYPPLVAVLLAQQQTNGSWAAEPGGDARFGSAYTTSLCVLILDTPSGLLPVFQR